MHCNDKSAQWWPLDGREGGRRVDLGTGTQSVSATSIFFYLKKKSNWRDFCDSPVVKTLCFHCRRFKFHP